MNYKIEIDRKALKFINKQPQDQKKRLLSAINRLPEEGDRRRLEGVPGLYRLRVGEYRVVYSVDKGKFIVYVVKAGPRGQIYKGY